MTPNGRMTVTTAVACVLASTALLPLFSSSLWFAIAGGAVITVAAAGALTRLRTLPVSACLAASVVGLLLYLNLIFEARDSLLLVIPTPNSLSRLWHLAGTGLHDANRYAPPAPSRPGLLLLAVGGVGITAVLTDLIAVRLRSTALAGLPLLVLFTVPVTMNAPHTALRQNTRLVMNWLCEAFIMTGTVNRTSSGSPASAVDRSRTAIRSVSTAVMPTPPATSSSRPGRFGT